MRFIALAVLNLFLLFWAVAARADDPAETPIRMVWNARATYEENTRFENGVERKRIDANYTLITGLVNVEEAFKFMAAAESEDTPEIFTWKNASINYGASHDETFPGTPPSGVRWSASSSFSIRSLEEFLKEVKERLQLPGVHRESAGLPFLLMMQHKDGRLFVAPMPGMSVHAFYEGAVERWGPQGTGYEDLHLDIIGDPPKEETRKPTREESEAMAAAYMKAFSEGKYDQLAREADDIVLNAYLMKGAMTEFRGGVVQGSRNWKTDHGTYATSHDLTWSFSLASGSDARVTLEGCTDLLAGKTSEITATAEPGGGTFRFWADPAGPVSVDPGRDTATLTGKAPGRAEIRVEYTSRQGKKAESSLQGSCVRLKSVNNGAPIPQVARYDAEGNITNWTQTVPVQVEPADGADLLHFPPADPAVLTAVPQGDSLLLQGIQPGKTTVQPQTRCGEQAGLAIDAEVVLCHKDYIAKLKKEFDSLYKQAKGIQKGIEDKLNDPEFERAANEIAGDTIKLAWNTARSITSVIGAGGKASSLVGSKAVGLTDGAKAASDVMWAANNVSKAISGDSTEVTISTGLKAASIVGGPLEAAVASAISAGRTLKSAMEAAEKFGKDLGIMEAGIEELEDLFRQKDKNDREFNEISRKLTYCKSGGERDSRTGDDKPQQKPTPGPKGQPESPLQPDDEETVPDPSKQGTGEQSPPEEPPPPPEKKPGKPGLPLPPEKKKRVYEAMSTGKGCGQSREFIGLENNQAAGLKRLAVDVEGFRAGPLTDFQNSLQRWQGTLEEVKTAGQLPDEQRRERWAALLPDVESIKPKATGFGEAGEKFLDLIGGCDEALPGVVKSLRERAAGTTTP